MEYFQELFFKGIIIFFGILILTFFQKFYYKILLFLRDNSFFGFIISFIIRAGVILHEFSHMFFAFLGGNKVLEVNLFSPNGGYVRYSYKNYIQAIGYGMGKVNFWLLLIMNQVGIFLTSLGPLIFGIGINFLFRNYMIGPDFDIWNLNIQEIVNSFDGLKTLLFVIYIIFIPSFVLSWKDISHFIISKQNRFLATLIGSIINIIFFGLFLFIFAYVFEYFVLFFISFFISFVFILIFFLFFRFCGCTK